VTYQGDTNLADPIVAPFVTKDAATLTLSSPVDGLPGSLTTTPVTDQTLWAMCTAAPTAASAPRPSHSVAGAPRGAGHPFFPGMDMR